MKLETSVVALERIARLLAMGVFMLLSTASPTSATPVPEEPTSTGVVGYADVELDIFSGRPNPTWTVPAEEIAPFLPTSETEAAEPVEQPGLGYRGFLITYVATETGEPESLWVYDGVVTIGEPGHEQIVVDGLGLEVWLLQDASSRGYGSVLLDMGAPIVPTEEQ